MRVIKIGGRAQRDETIYAAIAGSWHTSGGQLCVVHGGGDEVTTLQRLSGIEPVFIGGRRVTSEADIDVLRMALSGASNKRVVAALQDAGVRAIGVSGEDGMLIGAIQTPDVQLGQVGTPKQINAEVIQVLLRAGYLPVVSPMGRSVLDGTALNINGDDAASAIAAALGAQELLFVADVPGVLAEGAVVGTLSVEQAEAMVAAGAATGGMIAKIESALAALAAGVGRVRIGGARMISDPQAGTTITPTPSLV